MTLTEMQELLSTAPKQVVCDTEHLPDVEPSLANMLGVALAWDGQGGIYIPLNHWEVVPSDKLAPLVAADHVTVLGEFLQSRELVGWNIEHDREWIDAAFNIVSTWAIDGRILWYLDDREQTERGYGLKAAQVTLLGWAEAGDAELRDPVAMAGGRLDRGEHYLAPLAVLGRYAVLDALSTLAVVEKLMPVVDRAAHDKNRDYAQLLARVTRRGVPVDERQLFDAKRFYEKAVAEATAQIRETCRAEIEQIERRWFAERMQSYQSPDSHWARVFANSHHKHPRFNPNSPDQRALLLYDTIGLPVLERTKKSKAPKTDKKTIARFDHPSAKAFVSLSENEKLLQFSEQYLKHAKNGLMHFPHDTTATVSERLGGYAPYDLNMPFASEPIMRAFCVRPGYRGIHMDWVSIEPCVIAAFSGDETMLKVYRDQLGDIYLDLCLDLFPLSGNYAVSLRRLIEEFHDEYNTFTAPRDEQKKKFSLLRKVAKIIQLAVGYTGTKFTVARNLTAAGFPTTQDEAAQMVNSYWRKFSKVQTLAGRLKALAERRGYITGLFGRKLYIPEHLTKDALNRFGQFGGHVILREFVFELERLRIERGVDMAPLLPDIHDSTSWEVRDEQYADGVRIFEDAIRNINALVALPVEIRGEIKSFQSLYGLKNSED